jgi:S1-C subfamily serine protease
VEAFSDCLDCARYDGGGSVAKAGLLLANIPVELATQTRPVVRLAMLGVVALLIVAIGSLWTHNLRLGRRVAEESARVEGLAELLSGQGATHFTRVESLEARAGARERVMSESSRGVIFLQGAYGFVEATSRRPLRYVADPEGHPLQAPDGRSPVTVEGDGPVVEILYTGTAFVVDEEGRLLTNRHVALPWEYEDSAQAMKEQGFEPVMLRLIGYLPDVEGPFDVELVSASDTADVALLRCQAAARAVPPLTLGETPPRPGDEVVVLGYPTGMRALVARAGRGLSEELFAGGGIDFWELARALSARHLIGPLATQGIVGQVTDETIVYDAETTHGGSGGPVLALDGKVVAVNAAILAEFGGSNLGVPASEARRLIETSRKP